jgi:hypothetical protein
VFSCDGATPAKPESATQRKPLDRACDLAHKARDETAPHHCCHLYLPLRHLARRGPSCFQFSFEVTARGETREENGP